MEKFKGTPAPWTYSPQDGTIGHCEMAQVWDSKGKNLAEIEPTENQEQASANARLIAAAPDLLEALIDLKKSIDDYFIHGKSIDKERLLFAKLSLSGYAINKALGLPTNSTDPVTQAKIESAYQEHLKG